MMAGSDCFVLLLGRKSDQFHVFCYQFGGSSNSGLLMMPGRAGGWCCLAVERLSQVELRAGLWHTEPRSGRQPALMESISMPTLSLETTCKRGSEAVASVTGAPERCAG
jgi:hypothetical protein